MQSHDYRLLVGRARGGVGLIHFYVCHVEEKAILTTQEKMALVQATWLTSLAYVMIDSVS